MTSAEFAEWIAFHRIDPWSEYRDDLRMAMLATLTANINRGKGKRAFKVDDFIPSFDPPKKQQKVGNIARIMAFFCRATGGNVTNG